MIRLDVWSGVPVRQALPRVAVDRVRLRSEPFARLVGTSRGFDLASLDLRRWLLFTQSSVASRVVAGWDGVAADSAVLLLEPLRSRGSWGGWSPAVAAREWDGPVVAVTRARLRVSRERTFRRAVPAVAAEVATSGTRWWAAFGEAPVGFQGTVSVWGSPDAVEQFARRGAHREVMARTPNERWYAEELFTRCALIDAQGTLDGRPASDLLLA